MLFMELTPTFLTDMPRDFMDGQPLRYRRNEDGAFTLYSVGQNCLDDGGMWNETATIFQTA